MTMMVTVSVVVTQHPPVFTSENIVVDISKIVFGNFPSLINPYFPSQLTISTFAGNLMSFIVKFSF